VFLCFCYGQFISVGVTVVILCFGYFLFVTDLVVSTSAINCLESGKTYLRNDLLCVEVDVKPYTFVNYLACVCIGPGLTGPLDGQCCAAWEVAGCWGHGVSVM